MCSFRVNVILIISVNDDKNSGDEIDSKNDFEMDENQGSVEEISKEVEDNEDEVETSPAKV